MTPEKWTNTVNNIKDKFPVTDTGESSIDEEGGIEIEYIEFEGPMGKMRLEFVSKPVVLDRKTNYSKRIGSETQIDYIYSDSERSYKMIAFKWNDHEDEWEEMESNMFSDD